MDSSIYLISKELNQKDTKTELIKFLGYDGLCYLYASEKLNPQEYQRQDLKLGSQPSLLHHNTNNYDTPMGEADKIIKYLKNNMRKLVGQKIIQMDVHEFNYDSEQINNYQNTQFDFLKNVYNVIVETEDKDNIFGISYDKVAYLTKRVAQTSFQTFLPEIISIPNVALHPFANNKDITTL